MKRIALALVLCAIGAISYFTRRGEAAYSPAVRPPAPRTRPARTDPAPTKSPADAESPKEDPQPPLAPGERTVAAEARSWETHYLKLEPERAVQLAAFEKRYSVLAASLLPNPDLDPVAQRIELARSFLADLKEVLTPVETIDYLSIETLDGVRENFLNPILRGDETAKVESEMQNAFHIMELGLAGMYSHESGRRDYARIFSQPAELRQEVSDAVLDALADEKILRIQNRLGISGISRTGFDTVYRQSLAVRPTRRYNMLGQRAGAMLTYLSDAQSSLTAKNLTAAFKASPFSPEEKQAFFTSPLGALYKKYGATLAE